MRARGALFPALGRGLGRSQITDSRRPNRRCALLRPRRRAAPATRAASRAAVAAMPIAAGARSQGGRWWRGGFGRRAGRGADRFALASSPRCAASVRVAVCAEAPAIAARIRPAHLEYANVSASRRVRSKCVWRLQTLAISVAQTNRLHRNDSARMVGEKGYTVGRVCALHG